MTSHGTAFYRVKKENYNARAICKPMHTLKDAWHLSGTLAKPHSYELFHAHMKENTTYCVLHRYSVWHSLTESGLPRTRRSMQ